MSIEWDSLILGGNELNTVGRATENARRANSWLRFAIAFPHFLELEA